MIKSGIQRTQKEKNTMDKPKILIVDDDPDLRRGLNLRLRANHFDTAYATDGFSAIAMAQKERPDLIILDIGLPAGDGFIVLDRLQQSAQLSSIPVIVLTARDPQYNRERTLKAGACAFLQKPADNNELMDVIRTTLNPVWPGTAASACLPDSASPLTRNVGASALARAAVPRTTVWDRVGACPERSRMDPVGPSEARLGLCLRSISENPPVELRSTRPGQRPRPTQFVPISQNRETRKRPPPTATSLPPRQSPNPANVRSLPGGPAPDIPQTRLSLRPLRRAIAPAATD